MAVARKPAVLLRCRDNLVRLNFSRLCQCHAGFPDPFENVGCYTGDAVESEQSSRRRRRLRQRRSGFQSHDDDPRYATSESVPVAGKSTYGGRQLARPSPYDYGSASPLAEATRPRYSRWHGYRRARIRRAPATDWGSSAVSKTTPALMRTRKSVTALTAAETAALRSGISKMLALSDDRGYEYWAGIHGLPLPISCMHRSPLFLPWHRAYLYYVEQYLLDQEPSVSLPWWDWSAQQGLPQIYTEPTSSDGTDNPLLSAPITGVPSDQFHRTRPSPS